MVRSWLFWCWLGTVMALLVPVPLRNLVPQHPARFADTRLPPRALPAADRPAGTDLAGDRLAEPSVPAALKGPGALPRPPVSSTSPAHLGRDAAPDLTRITTVAGGKKPRTVAISRAGLRAGPSMFHPEIDVLHDGDLVAVYYRYDGAWLKVRSLASGAVGYVEARALAAP